MKLRNRLNEEFDEMQYHDDERKPPWALWLVTGLMIVGCVTQPHKMEKEAMKTINKIEKRLCYP